MVRRGGTALRAVVDDEGTGKRLREVEHRPELPPYELRAVLAVDDGEMPLHDGKRVAQKSEVLAPREAFLLGRAAGRAEKAGALGDRLAIHRSGRARDAVRDVAQENPGPVRDQRAREGTRQASQALLQERPLFLLPPEELLDAERQVARQDPLPRARRRAAISTVRIQSL